MKSIDIKSLLIGILGTALVMVLMGATHKKANYQIVCFGNNCAVMNTSTGHARAIISGARGSGEHSWGKDANF